MTLQLSSHIMLIFETNEPSRYTPYHHGETVNRCSDLGAFTEPIMPNKMAHAVPCAK